MILSKEEYPGQTNYITDGTCPICDKDGETEASGFLDQRPPRKPSLIVRCRQCNLAGMGREDGTVIWSILSAVE